MRNKDGGRPRGVRVPAVLAALLLAVVAWGGARATVVIARPGARGPYPSPTGGFWYTLPGAEADTLSAARFSLHGELQEEVVLRAGGFDLGYAGMRVDDRGRFWVSAALPEARRRWRTTHLLVFSPTGELLATQEAPGGILALDPAGVAYSSHFEGSRLEIWRHDPLSGQRTLAFDVPPEHSGGKEPTTCIGEALSLARADDGALFLLRDRPTPFYRVAKSQTTLRRYAPSGVLTNSWRLPEVERSWVRALTGGRVAVSSLRSGLVYVVDAQGLVATWDLGEPGPQIVSILPLAEGGVLLKRGGDLLRLDADGTMVDRFPFQSPPPGATWRGWQEHLEELHRTVPTEEVEPTISLAADGSPAEQQAAVEALSRDPVANAEALVRWAAADPARDIPWDLLTALFEADTDAVASRLVSLLPEAPDTAQQRIVSLLVEKWSLPGATLIGLLEEALIEQRNPLVQDAERAFTLRNANGEPRFPASRRLQLHYLRALLEPKEGVSDEGAEDGDHVAHVRLDPRSFFFAQLASAADLLVPIVEDPTHPGHTRVLTLLVGFPLSDRAPGSLGETETAIHTLGLAWLRSKEPAVAILGQLFAASTGDPQSVDRLPELLVAHPDYADRIAACIRRVRKFFPGLATEPWTARMRRALQSAPLDSQRTEQLLVALFDLTRVPPLERLANLATEPGVSLEEIQFAANRLAGRQQYAAALRPDTLARLVTSGAVHRLLASRPSWQEFRFVAWLWKGLEDREDLRRQLEASFLPACRASLDTVRADAAENRNLSGFHGQSPCLEALRDSDLGRVVPDDWLAEQVEDYAQANHLRLRTWLPSLLDVAVRRGGLPGFDTVLKDELLRYPEVIDDHGVETLTRAFSDPAAVPPLVGPFLGLEPLVPDSDASAPDVAPGLAHRTVQ